MKRIISLFLVLMCFAGMPVIAFAQEQESTRIDVYARCIRKTEGKYTADVKRGSAAVELPDGTVLRVSGIRRKGLALVVVPVPGEETEAYAWFSECLGMTPTAVYDIYFLDAEGNRVNADQVSVQIRGAAEAKGLKVTSVTTSGVTEELDVRIDKGSIVFTANGSNYYCITEAAGDTAPEKPEGDRHWFGKWLDWIIGLFKPNRPGKGNHSHYPW